MKKYSLSRLFSVLIISILAMQLSSCMEQGTLKINEKHSSLERVNCWFEVDDNRPDTTCYFMHVPQDYENPQKLWIQFPVVKISSLLPGIDKSPILHLGGGGPGNPMGFNPEYVENWLWYWYQEMSVHNQRDIYLVDPRGVGYARPVLVCDEYLEVFEKNLPEHLSMEEEHQRIKAVYTECRDRLLAEDIDLSQYHSLNVARDMEQLRLQLDIARWNLYGISYGTRYALTMARENPGAIESMVLDSAVFPNIRYMEDGARNYEMTLNRFSDYCRDDEQCQKSLPEAGKTFWQLYHELNQKPLLVNVTHPYRETEMSLLLNGSRFLDIYFNALYDGEFLAKVPEVIESLQSGKLGAFEEQVNAWLAWQLDPSYSDVAAAGHYCYEDFPFIDFDKALENAKKYRQEIRSATVANIIFSKSYCEIWGVKPGEEIESQPVITDVPVLFLHGKLDPVLPVEYLDTQMRNFKNSDRVIFDDLAHGVVSAHYCGEQLAKLFYDVKLDFRKYAFCLDE